MLKKILHCRYNSVVKHIDIRQMHAAKGIGFVLVLISLKDFLYRDKIFKYVIAKVVYNKHEERKGWYV